MDEKTDKQMSRGAMTAWIVGAMMFIAFIVLGLYLDQDDPRYPGCTGFMGLTDKECEYQHAARRLGGGSYLASPLNGDSDLESMDGLAAEAAAAAAAADAAAAASGE
jgi:hypothetical protein